MGFLLGQLPSATVRLEFGEYLYTAETICIVQMIQNRKNASRHDGKHLHMQTVKRSEFITCITVLLARVINRVSGISIPETFFPIINCACVTTKRRCRKWVTWLTRSISPARIVCGKFIRVPRRSCHKLWIIKVHYFRLRFSYFINYNLLTDIDLIHNHKWFGYNVLWTVLCINFYELYYTANDCHDS